MPAQSSPKPATPAKISAQVFAALGDETRLRLAVRMSVDGPLSITRLTEGSRVTRQAVTKHLRVMEQAGIVRSARRGRENVWQLERQKLKEARRYLRQISHQWDHALAQLKEFVEE